MSIQPQSPKITGFQLWNRLLNFALLISLVGSFLSPPGPEHQDYARQRKSIFSFGYSGTPQSFSKKGEVSPHYRHDVRDSSIEFDQQCRNLLADLLELRHKARKDRNYREIKKTDTRLLNEFGVRVYDYPPIWTRLDEPPLAHLRRQATQRLQSLTEKYGPRGHNFTQVGECRLNTLDCRLEMCDIHKLIRNRQGALQEGSQILADAIEFELLVHGVRLCEDWQQWTVDPSHDFVKSSNRTMEAPNTYIGQLPKSTSRCRDRSRVLKRIDHLVQERSNALFCCDYWTANCIEFELFRAYSVLVDDKSYSYTTTNSTSTSPSNASLPLVPNMKTKAVTSIPALFLQPEEQYSCTNYRASHLSHNFANPAVLARVEELVLDRIHKRQECKYREADALRRELWESYNVGVNDRLRQYSLGGVFDNGSDNDIEYAEPRSSSTKKRQP